MSDKLQGVRHYAFSKTPLGKRGPCGTVEFVIMVNIFPQRDVEHNSLNHNIFYLGAKIIKR